MPRSSASTKALTKVVLALLLNLAFAAAPTGLRAQTSLLPDCGTTRRYAVSVTMPRAALSGICLLRADSATTTGGAATLRGTIVNEFGLTAMSFEDRPGTDRVRLADLVPMLDKWYVRRTLRRDLHRLLEALREGKTTYRNERRSIDYQLTPMRDDAEE